MNKKLKPKSVEKLERKLQKIDEERRKLSAELQQNKDELTQIHEILSALGSSLDTKSVLQHALHAVVDVLGWEGGAIYLANEKDNILTMKHHRHLPENILSKFDSLKLDEGIGGLVSKTHEPHLYALDSYPSYLPYKALLKSNNLTYVCLLPLLDRDSLVGMMFLVSKKKPLSSLPEFFLLVCNHIGRAIASSQLHQRALDATARYKNLVESRSDVMYQTSPDGTYLFISPNVEQLVGHQPKDFHRRSSLWLSLVHPDDKRLLLERTTTISEMKGTSTLEYRVLPKGKAQYKWIRDVATKESESDATSSGLQGTLTDITKYKNMFGDLQQSNKLNTSILSNIQEGIVVFDCHLKCMQWNTMMETITAITVDAALGKTAAQIFPGDDSDKRQRLIQQALKGDTVHSDSLRVLAHGDKEQKYVLERYSPLLDELGTITGVVGILSDVHEQKLQLEELRQSEQVVRNVIDTIDDVFMVTDLKGTVLQVNRAFLSTLGYTRAEAVGQGFPYPWLVEEEMGRYVLWIANIREKAWLHDFDMTWKVKNGNNISMSLSTTLLRNSLGEPIAMLNLARDISERTQLAKELERRNKQLIILNELSSHIRTSLNLKEILDTAIPLLMEMIEAQAIAIFLTEQGSADLVLAKQIGFDSTKLSTHIPQGGSASGDVVKNKESLFISERAYDDQRIYPGHRELMRNAHLESLAIILLQSKGNILGALDIFYREPKDYSPDMRRIFELTGDQLGAAIENAQLYEETVQKTFEIEKRNKELDDFTYVVSHDLKEPLISIEGFSKILLSDYRDVIANEGKEYLNSVAAATSRMKQLIDDLLMLSRVSHPSESFKPISVQNVLADVLYNIEFTIKQRRAVVTVPEHLPTVIANEAHLKIVFSNLIGNAIKFNQKELPEVKIGFQNAENNSYLFFVKDNGIGIEKEFQEKIFVIFERLHPHEAYEGTGAGLAIVKKIIELHHGKIWVESELGKGSTFYFTISAISHQD